MIYKFVKSTRNFKKYDVFKNNKYLTSFGDKRYQHYEDKTPNKEYEYLNHYDNDRKRLYYLRHGKEAKKESAKWFSHKYLW